MLDVHVLKGTRTTQLKDGILPGDVSSGVYHQVAVMYRMMRAPQK